MAGQVWQKTYNLGKIEISTVTAGNPKRLFGTGTNGVVSAGSVDRQIIWLHNADLTKDLWYTVQKSADGLPVAMTQTTKHGRIVAGSSEPFTLDESLDLCIDSSSGTIAYVAREEM